MLLNLFESGTINKLKCLFDIRTKKDKLDLLLFAANITTSIYITNCHAKIIIIKNEKWNIAILSSANFLINKRYENGVICSIKDTVNFYKNKFETAIENAVPLSYDE